MAQEVVERSRTRRPPSHRRRFLAGVAASAALAVGLGAWLQHRAREADLQARVERSAVITLSALTDLVESASLPTEEVTADGGGINDELAGLGVEAEGEEPAADGSPQTVRLFAERHPDVQAVRVVFFDGQRLAASTAPEDTGERAAPRRLARDEKPLYDLGQSLRAAVEGNREAREAGEAGAGARREIAVERRPGIQVLTAPLERDTAMVGLVQIEIPAPPRLPGAGWILLQALIAAAAAALVFWLLSLLLGERRWALAAAAALLLLGTLLVFRQRTLESLESSRRASEQAVAAHVAAERTRAEEVLAVTGGAAFALNPGLWDVDAFRQPRGLVAAGSTADAAAARQRLDAQLAAGGARFTRALAVCGLLGLVLLAFVGFGGAARRL